MKMAAVGLGLGFSVLVVAILLRLNRSRIFAFIWRRMSRKGDLQRATHPLKAAILDDEPVHGRVLDLGSGDGAQLPYICGAKAPHVREVICVEPNRFLVPSLREAAAKMQQGSPEVLKIRVFEGTLEEYLEAAGPDPVLVDFVTCFTVLCCVPDVDQTLAAITSVLRPGGELRFVEHIGADEPARRMAQRVLQPFWDVVGDGCQLCRDTTVALNRTNGLGPVAIRARGSQMRGLVPMVAGRCCREH